MSITGCDRAVAEQNLRVREGVLREGIRQGDGEELGGSDMRFVHAVSLFLGFVCGISDAAVWLIWRGIGCVWDDGCLES